MGSFFLTFPSLLSVGSLFFYFTMKLQGSQAGSKNPSSLSMAKKFQKK